MVDRVLPSGRVISAASVDKAQSALKRAAGPETKELVAILDRLPPSLAGEFRTLRGGVAVEEGRTNLRTIPATSVIGYARSLLDAALACEAAGIALQTLQDLLSDAAVQAVTDRFRRADGQAQNASRILRGVRTLVRAQGAESSAFLTQSIADHSRSPRKDEGEVLPSFEEGLKAAGEMFDRSTGMIRDGKPKRGKTRMRDAAIMAVELVVAFRRGEFASISAELVFDNEARAEMRIIVREEHSKVRKLQVGLVTDPQVVALLRRLKADREIGQIFRTNSGGALAPSSVYKALRRTGEAAVGTKLNFNKCRRIGVTDETDLDRMRERVGHGKNSEVSEQTYAWHADDIGIDLCRSAVNTY